MSGTGQQPQEPGHDFEAELLAADRQFAAEVAAASSDRRAAAWAGWFEQDGCQVIPGQVVKGAESIASLMGPAFTTPGYMLSWDPDLARSSVDGTLGMTSGRYTSTSLDDGKTVTRQGRYVSVWKKVDGRWLVTLDTGVPDR
jgi:uncharacterized protein (TIGR02246 family)